MTRKELIHRIERGETFVYHLFLRGFLSQWVPAPMAIDGNIYRTAEHWMMAEKARLFNDKEALVKILSTGRPSEAKAYGRQIRNYNDDEWASIRFQVVVRGNMAKFAQNMELRELLLNTGNKVLVEANAEDGIWGIGMGEDNPRCHDPRQWQGENLLGFALMKVRDRMQFAVCDVCGGYLDQGPPQLPADDYLCWCAAQEAVK